MLRRWGSGSVLVAATAALLLFAGAAFGQQSGAQPAAGTPAAAPPANCGAPTPAAVSKQVRYVNPETMFEASSYSMAAILPPGAKTVLISGVIPVDKQYSVQGDDLKSQVTAVLGSLCQVMAATGVSKQDIVKLGVTYVHREPADPFVIAESLAAFFARDHMPATTMAGVSYLVAEKIRVQIEAVALVDQ